MQVSSGFVVVVVVGSGCGGGIGGDIINIIIAGWEDCG